jgi:uncharacterized membrane protein YhhN
MTRLLIPAISGVFAVADWVAVRRRQRSLEYFCKPAVMVALLAAALALHPESTVQRAWFVAALALSLAGDVFLMLPRDRFVFGLGSFLLAHLAYIGGLRLEPGGLSTARFLGGVEVVAVAFAVFGRPVLRAVGPSSLRGPVVAYMAVISVMVAFAAATGDWLALVGAALFYVSDASIAWNRFVNPFPSAKVVIIVTYHLAQFALVASLLT